MAAQPRFSPFDASGQQGPQLGSQRSDVRRRPSGQGQLRGGVSALISRFSTTKSAQLAEDAMAMSLLVQRLSALLRGGRSPLRMWDELSIFYASGALGTSAARISSAGFAPTAGLRSPAWLAPSARRGSSVRPAGSSLSSGAGAPVTSTASKSSLFVAGAERKRAAQESQAAVTRGEILAMLRAAQGATLLGRPVAQAIAEAATDVFPGNHYGSRQLNASRSATGHVACPRDMARYWQQLAACLTVAEASGCPLADVLSRFATQLEQEADAQASRDTALAGPQATASLLGWLPLMGFGLGLLMGVDPVAVIVGSPVGVVVFIAGIILMMAGRIWSSKLVQTAARVRL
ncbi:hypothetical protein ACQQCD_07525 [Pseudarthrobacter sp. J1763]|uniref:type II secretion system F family protein n=1 Tax=Pseudarthrobacter sp. J1763 TaxID=3420445 RepID=UPI003D281730